MTKSLKTLIKLKQREIDVLRREVGQLQEAKAAGERQIESLSEELAQEVELAAQLPDMGAFFGDFSEAIKQKQQQLREHIVKIEQRMDVLAEKITEHFSEQKKYEIALENEMKRQKKKREREEQLFLDEVAGRQHAVRQQSQGDW